MRKDFARAPRVPVGVHAGWTRVEPGWVRTFFDERRYVVELYIRRVRSFVVPHFLVFLPMFPAAAPPTVRVVGGCERVRMRTMKSSK